MLNKTPRLPGEAKLKYLDFTFKILTPGDFVVCAVTGKKIPLDDLKYWSVDKQEPYADAGASNQAMIETEPSE
ncbi:MAG: hypothetical protein CMK09_16080 [Ponticaulis sp.]|nr:hypothetical protein [Ponticaulis sp.]|tara:strand:- start:585 stop:803 length:219 start_codon:yes stop_codon:yes gene_type:complete